MAMAPINPKHVIMHMLVWNMRWMTRYLGIVARPIVRVYGENEIIACGLREEDGSVSIIYTPIPGHRNHRARMRGGDGLWRAAAFGARSNFSGSAVKRITLLGAKNGFVYKMAGENARGRTLSSPSILVKPDTVSNPDMLLIEPSADGSVLFSWPRGEAHDPMIYFLAIEGADGMSRAAIYTREHTWRYPLIKTASYSVGPAEPPRFMPGESLTISLALVDYDGWVTHLARRTCVMLGI